MQLLIPSVFQLWKGAYDRLSRFSTEAMLVRLHLGRDRAAMIDASRSRSWWVFLINVTILGGCAGLPPPGPVPVPAVSVSRWSEAPPVTDGLRAQEFIDTYTVLAPNGRKLGDVDNLILGPQGQISAVVVEADAHLGTSGEDLIVPWRDVQVLRDRDTLVVPPESIGDRGGAANAAPDDFDRRNTLQATDVLDAFLAFTGVPDHAYVEDFIFNESGEILAVIANLDLDSMLYERYDAEPGGYLYGLEPDFILADRSR